MKTFIAGFASISAFALLGLTACGAEGEGEGVDEPTALEASEAEGPVAEASEALAGASSCNAFVQSHIDWMTTNTCPYGGAVSYTIATHQASGLMSRTTGYLTTATQGFSFYNPITQTFINTPGQLYSTGSYDGTQTFSDRYTLAKVAGEAISRYFNFTPAVADQVKVTLTSEGKMVVKLMSWGGGEINVQPTECMNNLMYGFGNGILYSVTLSHACIPG
ncbi:MAG: hypothetical protein MUF34_37230 [Polyangiaceae bacterium]|jgi:hypothetical protein|nr:hypothetical protein [Polyangiaceae bacterium]